MISFYGFDPDLLDIDYSTSNMISFYGFDPDLLDIDN